MPVTYSGLNPVTGGYSSPLVSFSSGYSNPSFSYTSPATAAATSTAPYPEGSALGSATQVQNFDLSSSGKLNQLSDLINSINRNAQTQANQARVPNDPALEQQSSGNINAELQGQLPQDVMNLLGQQGAERGVGSGVGPDSANASAAYLRALGQTSLQQEQLGQTNLTAADARNPISRTFDPSTQLITPYQGAEMAYQGGNLNLQGFQDILNNQLAQQKLALQQQQQYSNPFVPYGSTTTGNTLTGGDVFPGDTTTTGPGAPPADTSYLNPSYDPSMSNWYSTPAAPTSYDPTQIDYSGDYASTPVSMYG